MIELKNVYKTYDNKTNALNDINIKIKEGEIFGIIGQSGAGKSTLIRCINMLETPTSGEVIINGKDITKLSEKELRNERKKIGMIFQHFNLLSNRTVYKNIAFPLELSNTPKEEQEKRINSMLELVGLTNHKNKYPSQLSGGQKQRLTIALALLSNKEIIIFDEPTSGLDFKNMIIVSEAIKDLAKKSNKVVIVVSHDYKFLNNVADGIYKMS